ncbi:hypothetical protein IE981_17885 [Klebsiella pneumoniae]|nr:hypothetical protein [Klebsiella pneumoniae]
MTTPTSGVGCCGADVCALSHPLRRNNAVAMGAMMYFIIFSQDIRRPPRLFKNEGIGWALRHFRVSENDKKGNTDVPERDCYCVSAEANLFGLQEVKSASPLVLW